ncbi:MAG: hypothetical protein KC546_22715, partial [Anaerolineae bacterium]|nr:hypothetical protein [Anaerolineae bacterium]
MINRRQWDFSDLELHLTQSQNTYVSEVQYTSDYRFRVWLALVNDINSVGVGHRVYLENIGRSFDAWTQRGYRILNPKGGVIDWNSLNADDLWGFLGKDPLSANGPGRRISDTKMAVIDLYFKIKAPTIAATFDRSNVLNSLATNLLSFFSEPTSRFYSEHFDERCEHLAGVYVSLQHFAQPAIKDAFIESD